MLEGGYSTGVSILLLVAAVVPVVALAWFAWWFLRAGKRYDERERAAGRRPPGQVLARYAAGAMFWLTLKTLSGSYCALTRASRS